jgi:hypothetical protein
MYTSIFKLQLKSFNVWMWTYLFMLPHSSLSDKAFPAQFAVMALYAKVLMFGLLVLVQVVLLGRPVVTFVTYKGLFSSVGEHVLFEFVLGAEFAT